MKRIFKLSYAVLFILMIPFTLAAGQDKKSEQKIKVVVNDGSGTKVVIDTVFKDSQAPDSIKLKDGSMVFINHHGEEAGVRHSGGREHYNVTYSSDNKNEGKEVREVTVISSDSCHNSQSGDSDKVMINCTKMSHGASGDRRYKVTTTDSKENGDKQVYVYINKNMDDRKNHDRTLDMYVSDDDKDSTVNKTKYVIAKDGMVVTVEGSDEVKAKELVKEIENKLGVKSEGTEKPQTIKTESKGKIKK